MLVLNAKLPFNFRLIGCLSYAARSEDAGAVCDE